MPELQRRTTSLRHRSVRGIRQPRPESGRSSHTELDAARAQLLLSASDPICVIDLHGYYLDANEAACRVLGYSREELLTRTAQQTNHVSDEVWQMVVSHTDQASCRIAETVYHGRDGTAIPVEVSVCRITYLGQPAILSVARNIARRKAAEAQMVEYSMSLSSLASGAVNLARHFAAPAPAAAPSESPLAMLIDQARSVVPFDNVTVALAIPETQRMTVAMHEEGGQRVPCERLLCPPALLEILPQSEALLVASGATLQNLEAPSCTNGAGHNRMGMVIPLKVGPRLFGVVSVGRSAGPGFTRLDADALQVLANQLAVAIGCSDLLDGIRAIAASEERLHIGHEMHDRMAQSIASAYTFASQAATWLRMGQTSGADWAIGQACKALQQANQDVRESIYAFRSGEVEPDEWVESLRDFVDQYERQWGIQCQFHVDPGAAEACGAQGRMGLGRIVQEALTNIRKHANTTTACVTIVLDGSSVLAQVEDKGRGFDAGVTPEGHYGLQTMRERARGLGGQLAITSGYSGTRLSVRLPAGRML